MQFVKAHGAGNDFILIEDLADRMRPTPAFVRWLCDRRLGVGADGLIRIAPAEDADFFMDYYNADGSVAEMCGNGIRCLAKFVADRGFTGSDTLAVGTRAGVKELELYRGPGGDVEQVRVDMGRPILARRDIPMRGEGENALRVSIEVNGNSFVGCCLSMGNPHAVLFVTDVDQAPVGHLGPAVERSSSFPAGTNVEFVEVVDPRKVRARVWERGVGETMACGTGACAIAVASHLRGFTGREVDVHLPGGVLQIEWRDDERVLLTGPAQEVFRGFLDPRWEAIATSRVSDTEAADRTEEPGEGR